MHLSAKLRQPFLFWPLVIAFLLGGWATVTRLVPAVSRWLGIAIESRVHIEHLVGVAAMVLFGYVLFAILYWRSLWLGGDLAEREARRFARYSVEFIWGFHLAAELIIEPYLSVSWFMRPFEPGRGHVQWDHVAIDAFSALLGYWLCVLLLKKQIPAGRTSPSAHLGT
jgi:hypothetical protein